LPEVAVVAVPSLYMPVVAVVLVVGLVGIGR
jgi:hypothetical protein